jgi:hypothetical protein
MEKAVVERACTRPTPAVGVTWRTVIGLLAAVLLMQGGTIARGQSIEPRSYAPAPTGVNFLIGGYSHTNGGLSFDTLPLENAKLRTSGAVAAYARTFGLLGRAAKFDVILPYSRLSGSATYQGATISRDVDGLFDPLLRVSVNLYGAPALTAAEFRSYTQDLIVGASVQVSAPLGQYDDARLINLGSHRWSVKPEIGVSKAAGPWVFEVAGGVTFYTTNDDFFGGSKRAQRPLYSARGDVIYNIGPGAWISVDATYFTGGRSTLNGALSDDLQRNWRMGTTLTMPVNPHNSIKLFASTGVSARTGNNFDLIGAAWQYRWASGM